MTTFLLRLREIGSLIVVLSALAAVLGCRGAPDAGAGDDQGMLEVALASAPDGVGCVATTVSGSRVVTRFLDITPGQPATALLQGLPTGPVAVTALAFADPCALVNSPAATPATLAARATWSSDAAALTLLPGVLTHLDLIMKRNGRIELSIGWDTSDDTDAGTGADAQAPSDGRDGGAAVDGKGDAGAEAASDGAPTSVFLIRQMLPVTTVVGGSASLTVNVSVQVAGPVGPLTITVNNDQPEAPFSILNDNCTGTRLGTSVMKTDAASSPSACFVGIIFLPRQAGTWTGQVTVSSGTDSASASLTGSAVPAGILTAQPTALAFPPTVAGSHSSPETLTLTNTAPAGGNSVGAFLSFDTGDFEVLPGGTCSLSNTTTLPPGASCTFLVRFSPLGPAGARQGTLFLSSLSVALSGAALPALLVTPMALDFGPVATGATSDARTLTLTNQSDTPLGTSAFVGQPFTVDIAASDCPAILIPGDDCILALHAMPFFIGPMKSQAQFTGDGTGGMLVDLSVTGVTPASLRLVSPPMSDLDLGPVAAGGSSAPVTAVVTNDGAVPSGPLTVSLTVGDPTWQGSFAVVPGGSCVVGATLPAGGQCSLSVVFRPPTGADIGVQAATLAIAVPGGTGITLVFRGTVITPTSVVLTPTPLILGGALPGSSGGSALVTVQNNTADPAFGALVLFPNLLTAQPEGDHPCAPDAPLDPGAACTMRVTLAPIAPIGFGPYETNIEINGATGVVIARVLQTAQLQITLPGSFPTTGVGDTSTFTFQVTNVGDVALGGPIAFALGGTNAADFALTADTCAALASGSSCTATVTFHPQAVGDRGATLTATSDGVASTAINFTASAAPSAALQVVPPMVSFPPTPAQGLSGTTVIIGNRPGAVSTGPLSITLSDAVNFAVGGDCLFATQGLPGGQTCRLSVTAQPQHAGALSGTLTVSAAPGGTVTVPLQVTVPGGSLTPTPETLSLTAPAGQVSARATVQIRNADNGPALRVLSTAIGGADAAQFRVVRDQCIGQFLNPSSTCTVDVVFVPSSTGAKTATLMLSTSVPGSIVAVTLAGDQ